MVENKNLKCFVGTAKNGAKYRACLPKGSKPYKKQQDLRGNPHSESKRKQPRQLAYPEKMTKAQREAKEKKSGVDSERAKIIRRWEKKINAETTKEGKEEMSKRMNKVLAKHERMKKEGKRNEEYKKKVIIIKKKKPVEKKEPEKKIKFIIKKKKKKPVEKKIKFIIKKKKKKPPA